LVAHVQESQPSVLWIYVFAVLPSIAATRRDKVIAGIGLFMLTTAFVFIVLTALTQ
jgi:hypothetical protein